MGPIDQSNQIENLSQKLTDHTTAEDKKFDKLENDIDDIDKSVRQIRDNHLAHLGKDVTDIKLSMQKNTTDMEWLKKFFWVVASSSIGALAASILNLVLK